MLYGVMWHPVTRARRLNLRTVPQMRKEVRMTLSSKLVPLSSGWDRSSISHAGNEKCDSYSSSREGRWRCSDWGRHVISQAVEWLGWVRGEEMGRGAWPDTDTLPTMLMSFFVSRNPSSVGAACTASSDGTKPLLSIKLGQWKKERVGHVSIVTQRCG